MRQRKQLRRVSYIKVSCDEELLGTPNKENVSVLYGTRRTVSSSKNLPFEWDALSVRVKRHALNVQCVINLAALAGLMQTHEL